MSGVSLAKQQRVFQTEELLGVQVLSVEGAPKDLNEGSSEASERDIGLGEVTGKGQVAQMLAD